MFVEGMTEMNLGRRIFLRILSQVTINTFKGVRPVFREYDCIRDGVIVSKAVLMSRMSNVSFMPKDGLFYSFGETLATERGKGYATLLHRYVLADNAGSKIFATILPDNVHSIKSAEKAGFARYAEGYVDEKMTELMNTNKVGRTDAAILAALNIADELMKEKDIGEHLRNQIKGYLDDAARAQNEVSELKRQLFKYQQNNNRHT